MTERLDRALAGFDADAFATRHGGYKESRSAHSREWLLPCPFCGSERLRWRHEPAVRMAWICWGCRRSGNTLDLVAALERCEVIDAIGYVVDGYVGGDSPVQLEILARAPTPTRPNLTVLPRIQPPKGFERIDARSPVHGPPRAYLYGRGIGDATIDAYGIGYVRTGRLARYVVFPCYMDGGLVYWQARATWDPPNLARDRRRAWEKATRYRKTLNPSNYEKGADASEVLFNYDQARASRHIVICEGPVDAIKVGSHAVALLGKVATPTKIERLLRIPAARYTVYLDPGEEERAKAYGLARQLQDFAPTFIAFAPQGYDPGALTPEQNAAVIARATPYAPQGLTSRLRGF